MPLPMLYQKLQNHLYVPTMQLASCEDLLGLMTDPYFAHLYESMVRFDPPLPFLIDNSSNIVTGHARYQILRLMDHIEVPVAYKANFSQAEIAALKGAEGILISNPVWTAEFIDTALLSMVPSILTELN